jgi:hypothetical protein
MDILSMDVGFGDRHLSFGYSLAGGFPVEIIMEKDLNFTN